MIDGHRLPASSFAGWNKSATFEFCWKNEANDFTPWLAEEANLKLLGDSLGMDLEFVSKETSVGPFYADILCKNALNGEPALIENQLEKTDHSHLGQFYIYGRTESDVHYLDRTGIHRGAPGRPRLAERAHDRRRPLLRRHGGGSGESGTPRRRLDLTSCQSRTTGPNRSLLRPRSQRSATASASVIGRSS